MATNPSEPSTVILINHEGMGQANVILQHRLIGTYLRLLLQNEMLPSAICFYTEGVKLVVDGSPVLEQLRSLEEKGVRMVVCSTCLNYYGLDDKLQVGVIGGMNDILEYQWKASKVITL